MNGVALVQGDEIAHGRTETSFCEGDADLVGGVGPLVDDVYELCNVWETMHVDIADREDR